MAALVLAFASGVAQVRGDLVVQRSPTTGLAVFVTPDAAGVIPVQPGAAAPGPRDFVQQHGHLFGVSDPASQLVMRAPKTDAIGFVHTTFEQVHRGVPVFAGVVKVHQNAAGEFVCANGHFFPVPDKLNVIPTLTADNAVAAARRALADDPLPDGAEPIVAAAPRLVIVDPAWYGDPPAGARLAWYLVLFDHDVPLEEAFFIDAHGGGVLDRWSLIHTVRTRRIHTGNGTAALPGQLVRSEGQAPVNDFDVDAAYDYYGDTYDYFFRAFGRDSIDGVGLPMVATVHSTAPGCPDAFWSYTQLQMVFCNGLVTDDIVGHELTHGVTQFTSNLIYQNQPGQINESLSDIFGELIDLFNGNAAFLGPADGIIWPPHPTGPGRDFPNNLRTGTCSTHPSYANGFRWLVGEDIDSPGLLGSIRDMWRPPCYSAPDWANSPLQTCNPLDNGGVHSGSGVPNHAFAMMTDGKAFNGRVVQPIGPIKAGAIWYRVQAFYLTVSSDFADLNYSLVQAANDLVGTVPKDPRTGGPSSSSITSVDAAQVVEALLATEMHTTGACGATTDVLDPAPPPIVAVPTFLYVFDFESGPQGWTTTNSGPVTTYDWVLRTGGLPYNQPGTSWYGAAPAIGDCGPQDETGVHYLYSPVLRMPVGTLQFPTARFHHFVGTEPGYDGGNVKIRINNGAWQLIPATAFTYNPYNTTLISPQGGNTNPIAGQPAWSGIGGRWGTSVIDLSNLVQPGDDVQFRFDLGKDGCTGYTGWLLDQFSVSIDNPFRDCNGNGVYDGLDLALGTSSDCNSDAEFDECRPPIIVSTPGPVEVAPARPTPPLVLTVQLDGAIPPLFYAWSIASGPGGGQFSDASSSSPTFTPDTDGEYVVRCTITDSTPAQACVTVADVVVKSGALYAQAGDLCGALCGPPGGAALAGMACVLSYCGLRRRRC